MSDEDCHCRPLGFLLGLPFALLACILCIIGAILLIIGYILSCCCPCCLCVTPLIRLANWLLRAPLEVILWFTHRIPC